MNNFVFVMLFIFFPLNWRLLLWSSSRNFTWLLLKL